MTKAANFLLQGDIFEKFEAYLGIVISLLYYTYNMSMLFTEDCSVRFSVDMFDNLKSLQTSSGWSKFGPHKLGMDIHPKNIKSV